MSKLNCEKDILLGQMVLLKKPLLNFERVTFFCNTLYWVGPQNPTTKTKSRKSSYLTSWQVLNEVTFAVYWYEKWKQLRHEAMEHLKTIESIDVNSPESQWARARSEIYPFRRASGSKVVWPGEHRVTLLQPGVHQGSRQQGYIRGVGNRCTLQCTSGE